MPKLKLKSENLYVASDYHLMHAKEFIYKKRGFSSELEHRNFIEKYLFSLLESDVLLYLGDLALNTTHAYVVETLGKIKATVYYIYGNHEGKIKMVNNYKPSNLTNIHFLGDYRLLSVDKQQVVLSHYPFAVWDHQHHGAWHLCGHSHGSYHNSKHTTKDCGKILDVGVETCIAFNGTPLLSWSEVVSIMDSKQHLHNDHHTPEVN